MARFSIDGEGTSCHANKKRRRKSRSRRQKRTRPQRQQDTEIEHKQQHNSELHIISDSVDEEEKSETESDREDDEIYFNFDDYNDDADDVRLDNTDTGSSASRSQPRNGSTFIALTDTDVLDCSICIEPLSVPVFQCDNGHTACASCCKNLAHKCPSCSLPIGYNRCRAIEKVLESVVVSCQNMEYGCPATIAYSKKREHEKNCTYIPCLCPVMGCKFSGSYKQLYQHTTSKHSSSVICFNYDSTFPVFFTIKDTCLILQEEKDGVLFLLQNRGEAIGNAVTVSCLRPLSSKTKYFYELTAKTDESCLKFQSFTENIGSKFDEPPSMGFLLVPKTFFGTFGQLTVDLCISRISLYGC